ncbi:PAC2 family protein [Roseiconus nitratireducens]|nr:PAC2 family protein [Roseiconus nitratireducens]
MNESRKPEKPWMIAVWPGMGHVASGAGYYLMAKLGMLQIAEFSGEGLFDVEAALVKDGLILKPNRPRNRVFAWKAPEGSRDVLVFIGEAQPSSGKYAFCERLIEFAAEHDVERVFTFAAMATEMQPGQDARVFAAATEQSLLDEIEDQDVHLLTEGHVSGLNGILLAAAAEKGMPAICLLGEMPHLFAQMPYPKSSLAVLRVFAKVAQIDLDFAELAGHAETTEHQLVELLEKVRRRLQHGDSEQPSDEESMLPGEQWRGESALSEDDEQRIESLFLAAENDRSRAYELKNELDRLGVFNDYEDRFLDLFKHRDSD